jgi:hypothetical protein
MVKNICGENNEKSDLIKNAKTTQQKRRTQNNKKFLRGFIAINLTCKLANKWSK